MLQPNFADPLKNIMQSIFQANAINNTKENDLKRLKHLRQVSNKTTNGPARKRRSTLSYTLPPTKCCRLIAYIRSADPESRQLQRSVIDQYCAENGYRIVDYFDWDTTKPTVAFHDAMSALESADGMIVTDLTRLAEHQDDPLRDLAPLVNGEFLQRHKHLISIKEAMNTSSIEGKKRMIEHMRKLADGAVGWC